MFLLEIELVENKEFCVSYSFSVLRTSLKSSAFELEHIILHTVRYHLQMDTSKTTVDYSRTIILPCSTVHFELSRRDVRDSFVP